MFFFCKGPILHTVAQFLSRKETQHSEKGKKKLLCEVVLDWCVSIGILMRHVYINPVFSQFGTANLQSPAEPCAVGFSFLALEVLSCFSNCSFKNKLFSVLLPNCSFKNNFVFYLCNCSFGKKNLRLVLQLFFKNNLSLRQPYLVPRVPSLKFYFPGKVVFFPDLTKHCSSILLKSKSHFSRPFYKVNGCFPSFADCP